MNSLSFYPKLNNKLIEKTNYDYEKQTKFFYTNEVGDQVSLRIDNSEQKEIYMIDIDGRWSTEYNDLIIKKILKFSPSGLFGPDGVAPRKSKLGVAIVWSSIDSLVRGVSTQFTFDADSKTINEEIEINFKSNFFRNKAELQIVLYLDSQANIIYDDEFHLSNIEGTILGVFEEQKYIFSGSGSTFPTEEFDDRNGPLWKLNVNDDLLGSIEDNVKLQINRAHKLYYLFNVQDDKYSPDFFEEVTIAIVSMIVNKFKDRVNEVKDFDYDTGTLGSLVSYYFNTFNIEYDDMTTIYSSVSKEVRR